MVGKEKFHRRASLNTELIFVVLDSLPSLQAFESIAIAYFSVIVLITFYNMSSETQCFNTNLNGLKNSYIQWLNQMGGISLQ